MSKRKVDPAEGMRLVERWWRACATRVAGYDSAGHDSAGHDSAGHDDAPAQPLSARELRVAVRFTLEELAAISPGGSVEVRVPPAGAIQAIAGPQHRRGTPPAVIETDPQTWLRLAVGEVSWREATESGAVLASGERADLSGLLPLLRLRD